MKISALLLFLLLLVPDTSQGEVYALRLRSSFQKDYVRIVLEGPKTVLSRAIVNQREGSVVVTIPDSVFTIHHDRTVVNYRKNRVDSIEFYPGNFHGLKVFHLKNPNRLVMDVYIAEDQYSPYAQGQKDDYSEVLTKRTIVIDPGHGGYDSGIVKDKYSEKNMVLDISQKLGALIESNTKLTFFTRKTDQYMSQKERVQLANKREPDIFLSLHVGTHSGFTLYFPVVEGGISSVVRTHLNNSGQTEFAEHSATLLRAMEEAFKSEFGEEMVVVRPLPYSMLSNIQAAAIMVELPSFEDASYIGDFRVEMAKSLYKGLYLYEENKSQ